MHISYDIPKQLNLNLQKIHVKTEVEICVGDITTVPYILDVPDLTIERLPNFSEIGGKFPDFAGLVGSFNVWDARDE